MAFGYRGLAILLAFLVVDCILIWIVNTSRVLPVTAAPITSGDRLLITEVLIGAAVIGVLVAIFYKVKPVPANLRSKSRK